MSVVYETDYARVIDAGDRWVVEDKVLSQFPVVARSNTKTFYRIEVEYVDTGGEEYAIARWVLPKAVPKKIVIGVADRITQMWIQRIEAAKQTMQVLQQAQQQQQVAEAATAQESSESSESEFEDALNRIRKILAELGVR